jgi:putative YpdA family bacillithiol system oxidoreductase
MNESLATLCLCAAVLAIPLIIYLRNLKKRDAEAHAAAEKGKIHSGGPMAQHPHIDAAQCIGCRTCTTVCPEGDVLAMIGGKAAIVNGYKCIGHGLCAEACPVGAITMVMAKPSVGSEMPALTPEYETSQENMFIVGELGGLALIKNAVNQGRDCVDTITRRIAESGVAREAEVYDVLIVGAGPAGISASLRAIENKLSYLTIERDELGGTVAKYPRQKLVMTSPVEFPMYGKFKKRELSKENLLAFWQTVLRRADFQVRTGESVEQIKKAEDGIFNLKTSKGQYRARAVILAIGRTGTPRKLGVPGEELGKVMYRLIEADHYINKNIVVVGGGDSAIEAAIGLGNQTGNQVILSYRKSEFSRIKERNRQRIEESIRHKKVRVIFNSVPAEITETAVVLDIAGELKAIPNDYVWVFAGGTPPNDFLAKVGVRIGMHDLTQEAGREADQAASFKKEIAQVQ